MTHSPVGAAGHNEPAEEVEVVDVLCAFWHFLANGTDEADDVDHDSCDVGGVSTPVDPPGVEVRPALLGRIEVFDLKIALADQVVIADHNTSNGREENGVGRKISCEVVGTGE